MHAAHDWPASLELRVTALEALYRQVQRDRMQNVALLNPVLKVEAIGFRLQHIEAPAPMAEGVLITPWFMSLVRLPVIAQTHEHRVGHSQPHEFGCECFDFIGAYDQAVGYHETCALFSPMEDFDTQQRARDTAHETLAILRPAAEPMPARRAFFLGLGTSPR
ncbi:MAG: [NiFe]-hydrogenase assembly chaperone HybE [Nevskiaceae bacterium]|jgi:[NiFe] hydrogenase assembly HybE family chaperone|nr:[NiFe]-hydrogenase assembly chaperone HybE [Nevskiaceae bacterium]